MDWSDSMRGRLERMASDLDRLEDTHDPSHFLRFLTTRFVDESSAALNELSRLHWKRGQATFLQQISRRYLNNPSPGMTLRAACGTKSWGSDFVQIYFGANYEAAKRLKRLENGQNRKRVQQATTHCPRRA